MRSIKGYLDEWRVQEYLLITFFISWLSWGILILLTNLGAIKFMSVPGIILFVIGGFGPTIAAFMCIEGKLSWKKLKKFIFDSRKGSFWYLLVFAILEAAIIFLSSMELKPALTSASPVVAVISIIVTFIIVTLFGGGNEELGWRGTLQPLLEQLASKKIKNKTLSFVVATVITGLIWALWHGPLWFVAGSGQQSIPFLWFTLSSIVLSFCLACIYRRTHSVFYCMLFHGISNLLEAILIIKFNWILCAGFIVMVILSIALAYKSKPVRKLAEADSNGNS